MENSIKFIINADDFGYNDSVNAGILRAFSEKLCSSTTLMANMGGFDQACEIIHENHLQSKTGLHFVLTEGVPLTDPIKSLPRICDSLGRFRMHDRQKLFSLSPDEKDAVCQEVSAQIERCRKNGLQLTHLDSHQHVHIEWALGKIVMQMAKAYKIPFIRLGRSSDPDSKWHKNIYRCGYNLILSHKGFAGTNFFGTPQDFQHKVLNSSKSNTVTAEIMIHPAVAEDGRLIDEVTGDDIEQCIRQIPSFENAVSYGDLAGSSR